MPVTSLENKEQKLKHYFRLISTFALSVQCCQLQCLTFGLGRLWLDLCFYYYYNFYLTSDKIPTLAEVHTTLNEKTFY